MGKILESIGVIDGYEVNLIGKMKAKKDKIFEDIEKCDSGVKEEIRKIVNNSSGEVIAIVKKGIIKGVYLFKIETKKDDKNLKHIKTVYTDEIPMDVREKYDSYILESLKEAVAIQEYNKITLNDKVIQVDSKKSKKEHTVSIICGFVIGFAIGWLFFEEYYLGVVYGLMFALVFGGFDVAVTNKRGRKKKDDK